MQGGGGGGNILKCMYNTIFAHVHTYYNHVLIIRVCSIWVVVFKPKQ